MDPHTVCVVLLEPSLYAAGADAEVGRGRDEGTQDRPEGRIVGFMSHMRFQFHPGVRLQPAWDCIPVRIRFTCGPGCRQVQLNQDTCKRFSILLINRNMLGAFRHLS